MLNNNEFLITDNSRSLKKILLVTVGMIVFVMLALVVPLFIDASWSSLLSPVFVILVMAGFLFLMMGINRILLRVDQRALTLIDRKGVVEQEIFKEQVTWYELRERTGRRGAQYFEFRIEAPGQKFYYSIKQADVGRLLRAMKENGYTVVQGTEEHSVTEGGETKMGFPLVDGTQSRSWMQPVLTILALVTFFGTSFFASQYFPVYEGIIETLMRCAFFVALLGIVFFTRTRVVQGEIDRSVIRITASKKPTIVIARDDIKTLTLREKHRFNTLRYVLDVETFSMTYHYRLARPSDAFRMQEAFAKNGYNLTNLIK